MRNEVWVWGMVVMQNIVCPSFFEFKPMTHTSYLKPHTLSLFL